MTDKRLDLALRELGPEQWAEFEKLAAAFLSVDYPSLRTTAAMHGDKGRDGQTYKPEEEDELFVQYSVTKSWVAKIDATVETLTKNFGKSFSLIYMSNQVIGADADELRARHRRNGVFVDIRDRSWFSERSYTHNQRTVARDEITRLIVDPLLAREGVAPAVASPLKAQDAKVALMHLALERADRQQDKGLTKSSFEALVRSVLHDTNAENPMQASEVLRQARKLLPSGDSKQIEAQIQGALTRLSRKGPIKHLKRLDAYHLSFEEQERLREHTAEVLLREEDILEEFNSRLKLIPGLDPVQVEPLALSLREVTDSWLLKRGEAFASAVLSGTLTVFDQKDLEELLEVRRLSAPVGALASVIEEVLSAHGGSTAKYLRDLSSAYTLFAFLRQTPDVQKAVVAVFSGGSIWLDTNVILPLLAETLYLNPEDRYFTSLLQAARDSGAALYITRGVIEETLSHISRSLSCARTITTHWQGKAPYLFGVFASLGRSRTEMSQWLELFRGEDYPEDDLASYLADEHGVNVFDLEEIADQADPELRSAVQLFWNATHEARRNRNGAETDPNLVLRLASHDVESTVGVLQLRTTSPISPMGFEHWWLTLDRSAFRMMDEVKDNMVAPPAKLRSPALNPDFLIELLRLRPVRSSIERELEISLPAMVDYSKFAGIPMAVIQVADETRKNLEGVEERVVRRRVREHLEEIRFAAGTELIERTGSAGT